MDKFELLKHFALPEDLCSESVESQETENYDVNLNDNVHSINAEFIRFSEDLLRLDDNKLNRVLEDIDMKHKIDEHDDKTKEIVAATETLVNGILQAAGEIDPRFKSKCIYSGSYYDGLKVGTADEFDFVARIEILSRKDSLEARLSERKRGFVYLVVKDTSLIESFKEFMTSPDDDPCLGRNDVILNVSSFQDYFVDLISSAIKSIDIPENFILVDKREDESNWRPFRHGPCATMYISYKCQTTSDVVNLDIDIAPSIAYPDMYYQHPVLDKLEPLIGSNPFLSVIETICFATEVMVVPFNFDYTYTERTGDSYWRYRYSPTWRISHSSIEKAIFSLYEKDSVEKKVCRILKILKELYLQGTLEVEMKSDSRRLKLQEPPSTRLDFCTVEEVTNVSSEYEFSTDTDDSNAEYDSLQDSQSSSENDMIGEDETYQDRMEHKDDRRCEIIYDRKLMANQLYSTPIRVTSSSKSRANSCFNRDQTQLDIEHDIETKLNNIPKFENEHQLAYQETDVRRNDFETPRSKLTFNIGETKLELKIPHNVEAEQAQDNVEAAQAQYKSLEGEHVSSNIVETELELKSSHNVEAEQAQDTSLEGVNVSSNIGATAHDLKSSHNLEAEQAHDRSLEGELENPEKIQSEGHEIRYRDSKPLLKTYMIKMLFFAMKTAYQDEESWQPNQLSFLVKMAMCMIYYAHISKQKGIHNFWFQELIENRTRSSTCTEVLYCLDHIVEHLRKLLEDDHNLTISSPE